MTRDNIQFGRLSVYCSSTGVPRQVNHCTVNSVSERERERERDSKCVCVSVTEDISCLKAACHHAAW